MSELLTRIKAQFRSRGELTMLGVLIQIFRTSSENDGGVDAA